MRWRSVGAVLAGIAVSALPAIATDAVLQSAGVFEAMGSRIYLLATAYRCLYGILGGYVTARWAPSRPLLHAMILAGAGFIAALAGVVVTWDAGPELGPKWYPLALVATAFPCAWLGARIAEYTVNRKLETI